MLGVRRSSVSVVAHMSGTGLSLRKADFAVLVLVEDDSLINFDGGG
jgi:hypothetical protein